MLTPNEYFKSVRRPYPIFLWSVMFQGECDPAVFQPVLKHPFHWHDLLALDAVKYHSKKDYDALVNNITESWFDPIFFATVKACYRRKEAELLNATTNFDSYCTAFQNYMCALTPVWASEGVVGDAVRQALSKKASKEEVDAFMAELNVPYEDSYMRLEEYELVNADDLKSHAKKYEWLYSRYGSDTPYTIAQANEHKALLDKQQVVKIYKTTKNSVQSAIEKAKAIARHDAHVIDLLQYVVYYRTQRADVMNRAAYLAIPMMKAKAHALGLTYDELLLCTKEEVLSTIPEQSEFEKRTRHYCVILENGNVRLVSGRAAVALLKKFEETVENVEQFKGTTANKGNVRGSAKIILNRSDFSKLQEGDILVTSMTTPEFLPVMKKAAAFVTDEGGITCHAAIVAREMQKPCIIGTKTATKILKDGDNVEVDANTGIVRILK